MDFFKKALNSVQGELKDIQQKGKEAIHKIEQKIQQKMADKPAVTAESEVIHVMDRIYWMNFPDADKIVSLSKYLNTTYANQYYIWNISEHKYDVLPFNQQVQDHNVPGYPSPTLSDIFVICKSIMSWLDSDPANVAIVHCQNTRGRSALIISCVLCLKNRFQHPGEALTFFCQQTHAKDLSILFASQKLYLNYFSNMMNGVKPNNQKLRLKKIILSEVPRINREQKDESSAEYLFRPYIQVFKDSKIIFNSLSSGKVPAYKESDLSICFDLSGTEITEDILIRCKHFETNQVRLPAFRMMLHSGFTHNSVQRLLKTDIDFADNIVVSETFFIDVIFDEINEDPHLTNGAVDNNKAEKSSLEYIVDECKRKQSNKDEDKQQQEVDTQKEIQKILECTGISSSHSKDESAVFSIGHSDSADKRKASLDEGEDLSKESEEKPSQPVELQKTDSIDSDSQSAENNSTTSATEISEEKKKVSQLLFKDKVAAAGDNENDDDVDLDNQEIDDYLDNLGKSDDES